jgi:hypothetical protein
VVATTPTTVATIANKKAEQPSKPEPAKDDTVGTTSTELDIEEKAEPFNSVETTSDDDQKPSSPTPAPEHTSTEAEAADTSDSTPTSETEAPIVEESPEPVLKEEQVQLTSQVSTTTSKTATSPATTETSS